MKTDVFGNFWFERNSHESYSLRVEKESFLSQRFGEIDATKDTNAGDIEIYKANL